VKLFRLIFLIIFFGGSLCAQNNEWKPIPLGDSLHTAVSHDRAIWSEIGKPTSSLFKSSLICLDQKPKFLNKIKPEVLPKAEFEQIPLTLTEQIPCDGDFLFKDNSTSKIKYLDKAHGFFLKSVYALAEDKKGNIYFGSESGGLGKFNGDFIQLLEGDSTFSLKEVTFLFYDSKERLWVGTKNKVGFIRGNKLHRFKLKKDIHVKGVDEDYKGNVWINTVGDGVFCIGKSEVLHYLKGLPTEEVRSVAVQKDGKIWFALKDKAIAFLKNDSLFGYPVNSHGSATNFYIDDDKFWISTFYGHFLQIRNDSIFKLKYDDYAGVRTTYSCFRNHLGLWFSVYGSGVYLLDDNGFVRNFSEENGLSDNHIVPIIPDQFGNVWAGGLFKGISRIEETGFYKLNNKAIIGRCSEIEEYNGDVWYFFNGGATTKESKGIYWSVSNAGENGMPIQRHFTDGVPVGPNEAWLGTWSKGIGHLKDDEFTYYMPDKEDTYDQLTFHVQIDDLQNVFSTTYTNRLYILRGNQIYDLSNTFFSEELKFYNTYKLSSGLIYVLCNKGVLVFKNGYYKFLNKELTVQNKNIQLLKEVGSSLFLFGKNGIQELNGDGELIKFYRVNQLKNKVLRSVGTIDERVFMVCTDKGVLEIDISTENVFVKLYDSKYGLAIPGFEYVKNVKGRLIISGTSGMYEYNAKFGERPKKPPLLELASLQLNNKIIELNQFFAVDQESSLEFVFSAISWGTPNQLSYQLIKNNSKNKKWRKNKSRNIKLEGLTFGKYKLLVKAINQDGESKVFSSSFHVKKDWYQMLWFKFFVGFLAILLVVVLIYIKNKRALRIQKKLELQVSQKTIELNLEKEELAKQLDDNKILLKEVHHRVKNNMQLVSSVLELQSEFTTDEFAKQVLNEGNDRIKALAFAHQKLYQNEDYENIELKDYFNQIIHHLLLKTACEAIVEIPTDFLINIERGQVLGFIVNELVVNSLKYAWKNSYGEKNIFLSIKLKENALEFLYKDNGAGFPKEFSLGASNSLGYTLIPSFVKRQLKGTLNCTNNNGAEIKITFTL